VRAISEEEGGKLADNIPFSEGKKDTCRSPPSVERIQKKKGGEETEIAVRKGRTGTLRAPPERGKKKTSVRWRNIRPERTRKGGKSLVVPLEKKKKSGGGFQNRRERSIIVPARKHESGEKRG